MASEAEMVAACSVALSSDEATLLVNYAKLNKEGREKAVEYITDLAGNSKYTKTDKRWLELEKNALSRLSRIGAWKMFRPCLVAP